jgi:hypothetical protein
MKKIEMNIRILTFFTLISFQNSYSQVFEERFFGSNIELYNNVVFKLKDDPTLKLTHMLYNSLGALNRYGDVIFPEKYDPTQSNKDSLKKRIFLVEKIIDKYGRPYTGENIDDYPIFILNDTLKNERAYFRYDESYLSNFPFLILRNPASVGALCKQITKEVDEFTGEIKFNTPTLSVKNTYPMSLTKVIKNGKATYSLYLSTNGYGAHVDGEGVRILFTDGSKWVKTAPIDVDVVGNEFSYSAFLKLSTADVALFATKQVKKFRLYIYDREVVATDAKDFMVFANCLKSAK